MKKHFIFFLISILFLGFSQNSFGQNDTIKFKDYSEEIIGENPYVMPDYPGGDEARNKFLSTNLHYPDSALKHHIQGKVYVSFMIEEDGSITDVKLASKPKGYGLDEEALRVIKMMPRWIPGKQNGKEVSVRFNLPISFKITDEDSADLKLLKETLKDTLSQKEKSDDFIYDIGSCDMPVFPGGDDALKAFLKDNLIYPDSALKYNIEGKVRVSFIVEKDGKISNVKVESKPKGFGIDEEAMRVVKLMPNWQAGNLKGKAVRVKMTLPIIFAIGSPPIKLKK